MPAQPQPPTVRASRSVFAQSDSAEDCRCHRPSPFARLGQGRSAKMPSDAKETRRIEFTKPPSGSISRACSLFSFYNMVSGLQKFVVSSTRITRSGVNQWLLLCPWRSTVHTTKPDQRSWARLVQHGRKIVPLASFDIDGLALFAKCPPWLSSLLAQRDMHESVPHHASWLSR